MAMKNEDLEFSDYGRSPRFVEGWWILPALIAIVLVASLISRAAAAQPAPSFDTQAAQQELMSSISTNLQLRSALLATQDQLTKAQAEIKRLSEPKEEKK